MKFKDLSIKSEFERFEEHLNIENNSRIIFSGIFGIGKTYFLEKYFNPNSEKHITIKLNPINYSISSNEDIFELIKFDIGFELFSKNPEFEKIQFDTTIAAQYYLIENYESIIKELLLNLPKLDHQLDKIVKPILKLYDQVKEYKKTLEKDDREELKDFLTTFAKKKGTYREENSITDLLCKLIDSLKLNNPEKEIVLLIDDLDRIDPEHIFRIMNVFSAHFDHFDQIGENKFGFDKVVLVCDINNVRGIFHSRYGINIDFSGYIDKFYSNEVFEYDFAQVITDNLDNFLASIKSNSSGISTRDLSTNGYIGMELKFLLSNLVKSNCISMRTLLNFLKSDLDISQYVIKTNLLGAGNIYSNSTPILVIFKIIEKIIGGKDNFHKAIEQLIKYRPIVEFTMFSSYFDMKIGNLIMLSDYINSSLTISDKRYLYSDKELDLQVSYQIHQSGNYSGAFAKALRIANFNDDISSETYELRDRFLKTKIPYFQLVKIAYNNINQIPKEEN